jgi:FlaA1/EpsC-like NDP-sugar epimerase
LAEQLIRLAGRVPYRDIEIVFTGLRPGEKLDEELVGGGEDAVATAVDKIRVLERSAGLGVGVEPGLERLLAVMAQGDGDDLIRAVSALVPEYVPWRSTHPLPVVDPGRRREPQLPMPRVPVPVAFAPPLGGATALPGPATQ